jgi:Flp pilus assembly protein TadG
MTRILRSLARDERGASIIEMAMVLPVLATLLVGMVDISRAYSFKLQLEQAAQRSIEKVQQYRTTSSTFATLQTEAATAAGVPTTDVAVDYWLECNGVRSGTYNASCPSGETYARYITVTITKKFSPMFGTRFFPGANTDGTYTIDAEAGLRTQ